MDTIKVIIEYDGAVTLNHEYTATVSAGRPLSLTWFVGADLLITAGGCDVVFNTANVLPMGVTRVDAGTFIVRPGLDMNEGSGELLITASERATLFGQKLVLELAESASKKYFTVKKDDGTKYAYPLPSVGLDGEVDTADVFLGLVKRGEFGQAKRMIAFDISDDNLKKFFENYGTKRGGFNFEVKDGLIQNLSPKNFN